MSESSSTTSSSDYSDDANHAPHNIFATFFGRRHDASVKSPPAETVAGMVDTLLQTLNNTEQRDEDMETRGSSDQLDAGLNKLAVILESVEAEIQVRSAALCKTRNGLTRINRLPIEILANILTLSIGLDRSTDGPSRRLRRAMLLSVVSTHWWDIIATTSVIWAQIDYESPAHRLVLERSRNRPLEVTMDGNHASVAARDAFGRLFVPHVARLKSLRWEGSLFAPLETALASTPTPFLETLEVFTLVFHLITIFDAPRLQTLSLDRLILPFKTTSLPNLTRLSLSTIHSKILPPVADIVEILTSYPNLEVFKLKDLKYNRSYTSPPAHPTLVLPKLKILALEEMRASVVLHFLRVIQAENLMEISFGDDDEEHFGSSRVLEFLSEQEPSRSLVYTALKNTTGGPLKIELQQHLVEIRWGSSAYIQLPQENIIDNMGDVINAFDLDQVHLPIDLSILDRFAGDPEDPVEPFDASFLGRLQTLSALNDSFIDVGHLTSLLGFLSTAGSDEEYPCPNLDTIQLVSRYEDFREMPSGDMDRLLGAVRQICSRRPTASVVGGDEEPFERGIGERWDG